MLAGRWSTQDESVIAAEHLANVALDPYLSGIDAAGIPSRALEAAAELDALIAGAPDATVDALAGTPSDYLLNRRHHRGEHIDQIERALEAAAAATAGPLDRTFVERNTESRRHMAALVERLTTADYTRPTEPSEEGSWTIAQVLGHLAFWDRSWEARWLMAMEAAGEGGAVEPVSIPQAMTEAINRPLAALLGEWTERLGVAVGAQAVAAAESLDALLESLGDRLPAGAAAERPALVNRWAHREPHLRAVEAALTR
jgi:hypothetical protein